MCGIGGYVGGFLPGLAACMNAAQAHRGPDGQGIFEDAEAEAALGHVRLSILDLTSAAAQPMHSPDGRYVLVFNGEIYNFQELRQNLITRGHHFISTGDTEVLLHGLMEYGLDFIPRLNGMYAFALWDRREQELLIARDPLGIKPLYYTEPLPGTLLFASEIKALCVHPCLRREPDFIALQQHLAYCHASGERTALAQVKRLLPGYCLRWRAATRSYTINRFWQLPFRSALVGNRTDAIAALREALDHATTRQLISDVPIGAFLSGGLDSSVLTALAVPQASSGFACFTTSYPPEDNQLDVVADDLTYARQLAQQLDVPLYEIPLRPQVAELWPRLIAHLDEPIADPAAIACYLICQLAREHNTKVLLSGQGGDELFCGYPRYGVMHATAWLTKWPLSLRRGLATLSAWLPGAWEGQGGAMLRRIRRVLQSLGQPPAQCFLDLCANTPQHEIYRILSPAVLELLAGQTFRDDCLNHMTQQGLHGLQALQERDLAIYLPNHNLLYTDKMGMAVGVEARVPLLDLELVELVLSYPYGWLLAGVNHTKVLFREAAKGIVPDTIIRRPKAGFGAPYRKWLRYDLADLWHELTSREAVTRRGWFDYAALQDARARSQAGKDDLYMLQWAVLTIELWARQFIDHNSTNTTRGDH